MPLRISKNEAVSKSKPKLSLCMIVKDEEAFIEDCLKSVEGVVDEIIILDTGSKDRTIEIAKSFGVHIHEWTWNEHYSDARNQAIRHATGDWILSLDADERLDEMSKPTLLDAISNPTADGYELRFHNYHSDSPNPDIIHHVCRLYRNGRGYEFEGRIHENIVPSIITNGGTVSRLDVLIHHYGYRPEIIKAKDKHRKYVQLLEQELAEKPGDLYVLHHLAAAHLAGGEPVKALPYLKEAAERIEPRHTFAAQIFSRLANAYWALERPEDTLDVVDRAWKMGIQHPELTFSRGNALLDLKRYEEAINAFRQTIELGATQIWQGDQNTSGYKAYYGLAVAYNGLGNLEQARDYCLKVIEDCPLHLQANESLARIFTNAGELDKAEKHWTVLRQLLPDSVELLISLAGLHERRSRFADAIECYRLASEIDDKSAKLHACMADCYTAVNDMTAAEEHYIRAIELDGSSADVYNNLGLLYARRNQFAEAIECYGKAVEVDETYANAYFNAADLLYSVEQFQKAAEVYHTGLLYSPQHAPAYLTLGNSYFQMGAYEAAAAAYNQALQLRPNYYEAQNNLSLAEAALTEIEAIQGEAA